MKETRRKENEKGRYTLIFLAAPNDESAEIEFTYNWDGIILEKDPETLVICI
ncbi:MAG: hypothetical protein Ct9H300mP5_1850 [Candidatus Pelagibacterales bacterium]|nr:MAG: hypothetical protein Ct9H300mP5_1850 [Pelagibacterales bacterium]